MKFSLGSVLRFSRCFVHFCHSIIHWFTDLFLQIFRTKLHSNREIFREWSPLITCHMSDVMCQVSGISCHMSLIFYKVVGLVGGGCVLYCIYLIQYNRPHPVRLPCHVRQAAYSYVGLPLWGWPYPMRQVSWNWLYHGRLASSFEAGIILWGMNSPCYRLSTFRPCNWSSATDSQLRNHALYVRLMLT